MRITSDNIDCIFDSDKIGLDLYYLNIDGKVIIQTLGISHSYKIYNIIGNLNLTTEQENYLQRHNQFIA